MKRILIGAAAILLAAGLSVQALAAGELAGNAVQTPAQTWTLSRSAMPGERVLCRSVLELSETGGAVLRCQLSKGVSFSALEAVTIGGERVNAAYYTIVTRRQPDAFTLYVSDDVTAAGGELAVEYAVYLNDGAAGENTVSLTMDGAPRTESALLRTFSLTALREVVLPDGREKKPVGRACLCLSRDKEGRDRVAFRQRGEDTYLACTCESCGHARHYYMLKTPSSGKVYLEGLSAGTYYLRETRPVEGQTAAAAPVEITVRENGAILVDGEESREGVAELLHRAAAVPEERAGFTLLDFYRAGSIVLALALGVLMLTFRLYL